jgi:hypothetical protein
MKTAKKNRFGIFVLLTVVVAGNFLPFVFHCLQVSHLHAERFGKRHFHPDFIQIELSEEQYKNLNWEYPGKEFVFQQIKYDVMNLSTDEKGRIHLSCSKDDPENELAEDFIALSEKSSKDKEQRTSFYWTVWFPLHTNECGFIPQEKPAFFLMSDAAPIPPGRQLSTPPPESNGLFF